LRLRQLACQQRRYQTHPAKSFRGRYKSHGRSIDELVLAVNPPAGAEAETSHSALYMLTANCTHGLPMQKYRTNVVRLKPTLGV
jgi:hypothetical protein